MHVKSLLRRVSQLRSGNPAVWAGFVGGWMRRRRSGVVPCILPGAKSLLYLPLRSFYDSYQFFSEVESGRRELAVFLAKLRPGDVLYDIGGFHGAYGVAAKLKLGKAITVHAFEPVFENSRTIARICALNAFEDLEILNIAVGDASSIKGKLNSRDGMLKLGDEGAGEELEVKSISLDEYVASGAPPPSIAKIDVEGYEWHVLNGAHECLKRYRPRIWLELHPQYLKAQEKTYEDVLDCLRQVGYSISFLAEDKDLDQKPSFHVWCT